MGGFRGVTGVLRRLQRPGSFRGVLSVFGGLLRRCMRFEEDLVVLGRISRVFGKFSAGLCGVTGTFAGILEASTCITRGWKEFS